MEARCECALGALGRLSSQKLECLYHIFSRVSLAFLHGKPVPSWGFIIVAVSVMVAVVADQLSRA